MLIVTIIVILAVASFVAYKSVKADKEAAAKQAEAHVKIEVSPKAEAPKAEAPKVEAPKAEKKVVVKKAPVAKKPVKKEK